jgi:anaerobic glycerol-3-phosphate dehydrogenase
VGGINAAGSAEISQDLPANTQATPLLAGQFTAQGFKFSAIAQPNFSYRIQSSTDLISWQDEFTFVSTQAFTRFTNSNTAKSPIGFYRIVSP